MFPDKTELMEQCEGFFCHHTYNSLVLILTIFWLNWWACFINPRDSKVSGSSLSFRMASGTKN